jgi:hypothetical protein
MTLEHLDDQKNEYHSSLLLYQFVPTVREFNFNLKNGHIFIIEQFINYHMQCYVLYNIQDISLYLYS